MKTDYTALDAATLELLRSGSPWHLDHREEAPAMTPNWPRFAQLTATPELFAIIDALGVEVPPEGRPRRFRGYRDDASVSVNVEHYKDTGAYGFVVHADGSSRYLSTAKAIRQALRIPAGMPTHKALLRFLAWWGLEPPDKDAAAPAPNDQTRMIT